MSLFSGCVIQVNAADKCGARAGNPHGDESQAGVLRKSDKEDSAKLNKIMETRS